MNATIHRLEPESKFGKMECSGCGASTDAACACGVAYIPAAARVAAAVKASPEKSNVAIAKEIGVSEKTVRNHRPTSDMSEVRTGRDGKVRRMPKKAVPTINKFSDQMFSHFNKLYGKAPDGRDRTPEEVDQMAAVLRAVAQRLVEMAEGLGDCARKPS
jgi:hypothetical protein